MKKYILLSILLLFCIIGMAQSGISILSYDIEHTLFIKNKGAVNTRQQIQFENSDIVVTLKPFEQNDPEEAFIKVYASLLNKRNIPCSLFVSDSFFIVKDNTRHMVTCSGRKAAVVNLPHNKEISVMLCQDNSTNNIVDLSQMQNVALFLVYKYEEEGKSSIKVELGIVNR